jgi:hypothetical protein
MKKLVKSILTPVGREQLLFIDVIVL